MMSPSTQEDSFKFKFQKLYPDFAPLNLVKSLDKEDEWMVEMEKKLRNNFCATNESEKSRSNQMSNAAGQTCMKQVPAEVRQLASNFQEQMMKQIQVFTEMVFEQTDHPSGNAGEVGDSSNNVDKGELIISIQSLVAFISNKVFEYQFNST